MTNIMSERIKGCDSSRHAEEGACYRCCDGCNYQTHKCHFCGSDLTHNSFSSERDPETGIWGLRRHWLSDCRADLVEHAIGSDCTWSFITEEFLEKLRHEGKDVLLEMYQKHPKCYAYEYSGGSENSYKSVWTDQHIHFHKDGPMT